MSEGTEISTVKISGKKLMTLVHLPYKYLSHTTITLEDIAKKKRWCVFFDLRVVEGIDIVGVVEGIDVVGVTIGF